MIEWLRYLIEWVHFVLRHPRDVQLGRHVNRLLYPGTFQRVRPAVVRMARRYIALMGDPDYYQRHTETIIRAGY